MRKLHNEELHNLYALSSIIRMIMSKWVRCAGHVACREEKRNACMILVGKPEGKKPLRMPTRRWEDIKVDLREIGWGGMDWIDVAQDREQWRALVNMVMNFRVP
jgi:hypothetical protein